MWATIPRRTYKFITLHRGDAEFDTYLTDGSGEPVGDLLFTTKVLDDTRLTAEAWIASRSS